MLNLNFDPVLDEFSILPDLGHIKLATETLDFITNY